MENTKTNDTLIVQTGSGMAGRGKLTLQVGGEDADLPVIAVENGGGIRAGVTNGDITAGDLINAFPFTNTLYLKKITPAILYEVMEVSGTALDGQTVPLDRNDSTTEIMMVSNNYIMSGGSNYTMLRDLPKYGEAGEALADQKLSYRVDGGERRNGTTDKDGMLQITRSDGAHGVRLADTQQEIYIDNYSGFGIVTDQYRLQAALTFFADGSCDPVPEDPEEKPDDPLEQDGTTEEDQNSGDEAEDPQSGIQKEISFYSKGT